VQVPLGPDFVVALPIAGIDAGRVDTGFGFGIGHRRGDANPAAVDRETAANQGKAEQMTAGERDP
jgi:hypothetical protein